MSQIAATWSDRSMPIMTLLTVSNMGLQLSIIRLRLLEFSVRLVALLSEALVLSLLL